MWERKHSVSFFSFVISISSQGSSLWESVPAGHPAVSASLISDSGPLEASLWSSVQPHYVWAAKGAYVHCKQMLIPLQ